jgi:hypothetical protein
MAANLLTGRRKSLWMMDRKLNYIPENIFEGSIRRIWGVSLDHEIICSYLDDEIVPLKIGMFRDMRVLNDFQSGEKMENVT